VKGNVCVDETKLRWGRWWEIFHAWEHPLWFIITLFLSPTNVSGGQSSV
jgi:hypothetical protein